MRDEYCGDICFWGDTCHCTGRCPDFTPLELYISDDDDDREDRNLFLDEWCEYIQAFYN